jgi:hypothetical protein
MLRRNFTAAVRALPRGGKASVTPAEILKIVAKAWHEAFDPSLIKALNADVGYYIDSDGFLQWDLTRLLPVPPAASAPAAPARAVTAPTLAPPGFATGSAADAQAAADAAAATSSSAALSSSLVTSRRFGRHRCNAELAVSQSVAVEDARRAVDQAFALDEKGADEEPEKTASDTWACVDCAAEFAEAQLPSPDRRRERPRVVRVQRARHAPPTPE